MRECEGEWESERAREVKKGRAVYVLVTLIFCNGSCINEKRKKNNDGEKMKCFNPCIIYLIVYIELICKIYLFHNETLADGLQW